jgi:hypothetical protein
MKIEKMKRGAHRREDCIFVGAWIPKTWVRLIDDVVRREDLDRSKVIRRAVTEKLGVLEEAA